MGQHIYKTYKYRLYPNKTQEKEFERLLGVYCALYNQLIEFFSNEYRQKNKRYSLYDKYAVANEWRKGSFYLQDLLYVMARWPAYKIHQAFLSFFKLRKQDPKAMPPGKRHVEKFNTFGSNGGLDGFKITKWGRNGKTRLNFAGIGEVRTRFHREMEGEAKTWEITRSIRKKWYLCIACRLDKPAPMESPQKEVGIDLGVSSFIATSDGDLYPSSDALRRSLRRLKILQRKVSKKKKGSNRWHECQRMVNNLHHKIKEQRLQMHHEISKELLEAYDVIYVEALKVKNMVRNHSLALSISDAGWAQFVEILEYKAEERGKYVVKVDPKNTSQACSGCGQIVKKGLAVRVHRCDCGLEIDRDVNAAINIMNRGRGEDIVA